MTQGTSAQELQSGRCSPDSGRASRGRPATRRSKQAVEAHLDRRPDVSSAQANAKTRMQAPSAPSSRARTARSASEANSRRTRPAPGAPCCAPRASRRRERRPCRAEPPAQDRRSRGAPRARRAARGSKVTSCRRLRAHATEEWRVAGTRGECGAHLALPGVALELDEACLAGGEPASAEPSLKPASMSSAR